MKKHLLIIPLFVCSFSFGQGVIHPNNLKPAAKPAISFNKDAKSRSVSALTCANDTTFYSYLKEETQGTGSYFLAAADDFIIEWSQSFLNTGTLTVKGISFWGGVQDDINPAQTLTADVVLYNVDGTLQPTTVIATQSILLTTAVGFQTAMFSVPQTVTGNYAVAIKNSSTTDTVAIVVNNAATGAGTYAEGLSFVNAPLAGGWYAMTAAFTAPAAYEPIIAPVISYSIATDYTMSPVSTTMCLGTALTFTNTTSPATILNNRMYNYGAYNAFWNTVPDSIYAWDMGDGSALQWSTNAAYTYPGPGLDTVTLYTIGGLFSTCLDTKETYLNITPNASASYTQNTSASPLIAFTSTSTDAVTYAWDFGDGSPIDNTANPSHVFAPGTWTVTLTVTSAGGCNTDITTQIVTILSTDIADFSGASLNVYPNPSADGLFTIELAGRTNMNVQIFNTIGELVYSTELSSSVSTLDLSSVGAGFYSMKIRANDQNIVKQIVITK